MKLRAKIIKPKKVTHLEEAETLELLGPPDHSVLWVDAEAPDEAALQQLADHHGIHELVHEDVLSEAGRARVERIGDHLVMVFKALNFNPGEELLDVVSVFFVVTPDRVLTFHSSPVRSINEAWESLKASPSLPGPMGIVHEILSRIMLRYLEVSEELDERIEELEPDIVGKLDENLPTKIYEWKRKILGLKKRIRPHRDAVTSLLSVKHDLVTDDTRPYLRDILDQVLRTEDRMANHRDLLQGAIELYMAEAAQEANDVMKTLSLVATIVLPLNILTGVYGTNFEILPGSKVDNGFWIFVIAMIVMAGGTAYYFKRRGWL